MSNAGSVQLFSESSDVLDPGTALTQNTAGVGDSSQTGDLFGDEVAFAPAGVGAPGTKLAVSAPDEDGAANSTGLVQVFPMSDLDNEDTYTQSTAGVPGAAEAGDRFGSSVAIVTGGSEQALIVGVPDDVGNSTGMVDVIPLGRRCPALLGARHRGHSRGRIEPLRRCAWPPRYGGASTRQGVGQADIVLRPGDDGAKLVPDRAYARAFTLRVGRTDQSYVDLDDPRRLEFDYVQQMAEVIDALAAAGTNGCGWSTSAARA